VPPKPSADARVVPFAANATELMPPPPGPMSVAVILPVPTSQRQTLPLPSPAARVVPSGANATELTPPPAAVFGSSGCQVIGTVWEAEQQTTALIFEAFYRRWNLSTRTSEVAAALQQAMAEVRTGTDSAGYPLEHPVRWAPYVLVG
jgi:hypothetical protein